MNNSKPMKSYQFITKYLILLALPMLLSIGSLYAISLLIHRMSMEQKISALNHTLAVAEQGIIEHAEQLLALEVEIFKSAPPMDFEDHKAQLREVWATKVCLTGMLDLIFLSDAHGVSFSSDAERDAKQAERNTQNPGRTTGENVLYRQALESLSPTYWTPPYRDGVTGRNGVVA